jgi:hypothetical protein
VVAPVRSSLPIPAEVRDMLQDLLERLGASPNAQDSFSLTITAATRPADVWAAATTLYELAKGFRDAAVRWEELEDARLVREAT